LFSTPKNNQKNLFNFKGRLIKYGVIDTEDFEADLLDWPKLYIAGRLHKPVLNVLVWPNNQNVGQSPNRPIWQAINDNRWMAVQAALLLLPDKFSVKVRLCKIFLFGLPTGDVTGYTISETRTLSQSETQSKKFSKT